MTADPSEELIKRADERQPLASEAERIKWFRKKLKRLADMSANFSNFDEQSKKTWGSYYVNEQTEHQKYWQLIYSVEGGWGQSLQFQ